MDKGNINATAHGQLRRNPRLKSRTQNTHHSGAVNIDNGKLFTHEHSLAPR